MKHYIELFYQDIKISFFQHDGQYYMMSEDVGRCLRMNNPKNGIKQYIHRHPELATNAYSIMAQINTKQNRALRCFSHRGLLYIAKLRGDHDFKQWVDDIYKALDAGLLNYEEADSHDVADETRKNNAKQMKSESVAENKMTAFSQMTDFERAQIILGIAALSDGEERNKLKQAATELLLNHSFEDVYEAYLTEYGELF